MLPQPVFLPQVASTPPSRFGINPITIFRDPDGPDPGRLIRRILFMETVEKKKVVRSDDNGRIEIYEPQIITRKCTMCHIHRDWRGKEGMVGGITYAVISTEEFALLQQNNKQLLSDMDSKNKSSMEEAKHKNLQNISGIRHSYLWSAIAALCVILFLSILTMQFSVIQPMKYLTRSPVQRLKSKCWSLTSPRHQRNKRPVSNRSIEPSLK